MGAVVGIAAVGFPITRPLTSSSKETRSTPGASFCCLIRKQEEAWFFHDRDFDFRSTLSRVKPTREGSFMEVVRLTRAAYPGAVFDDSLPRFPAALRSGGRTLRDTASESLTILTTVEKKSNAERAMMTACLLDLQIHGR